MKKIFSLFAALTLSVGLWAIDNVAYIDANGQPKTANGVTEIVSATSQVTWNEGWYVVTGSDVTLSQGAVCNGAVNIILADNAKLTATGWYDDEDYMDYAGIQISSGKSLTIYAQSTGSQMGQLIAVATDVEGAAGIGGRQYAGGSNITINGGTITANGGRLAAGIGGGEGGNGSNITINGGIVEATGGEHGAGIGGGWMRNGSNITINGGIVKATGGKHGAGIGGGYNENKEEGKGDGLNITINGGTITANGGENAAGIGGGDNGSGSSIFVATICIVKADNSNPPTTVIKADRTATMDIANDLAGKQYATVIVSVPAVKNEAIAAIDAAIEGVTDEAILAIAATAKTNIGTATTVEEINSIKTQALADIALVKAKADAIAAVDAAIVGVTDESILAIATAAKTNISTATTVEGVDAIKVQALADIDFAKYKADAIAAVDAAIAGVTDESILAIATTAKTNISTATTVEGVDEIKAQALTDIDIAKYKAAAVAEIEAIGQGIQNTTLKDRINGAIADIKAAGTNTKEKVDNIKNQILPTIQLFLDGKTEGLAEAQDELPTEGTTGPAITITLGDKSVTFYNTEKVEYSIVDAD